MISNHEIIKCASQLRENIGIDIDETIGSIVEIIQNAGYQYVEDHFNNDFAGFSKYLDSFNYLIGYNLDQNWNDNFKRFTLAHELGHVSMLKHCEILKKGIMHRSQPEYQSDNEIEREADYFAINFLAPKKLFEKQMEFKAFDTATIFALSDFFGISTYAAVLRFVELTDLTCSLIVCNKNGYIDYEKRSEKMKQTFRHDFLRNQKILGTTLTSDWIKGNKEEETCDIPLNEWYRGLDTELDVTESVIELGYNNKYLTLLEPKDSDIF